MKRTRLEVFSNNVWREVDLFEDLSIKYNKISNRIGTYGKRDISHSNTFSIPSTSINIDIFQLNRFNPATMARSLNSRYQCRYFLDEILFDSGFLIINNTKEDIKVNFLSQEIDLVDRLKSTRWLSLFTDLSNYQDPNASTQLATYLQQIAAFDLETMGDAVVAPAEYTRDVGGQVNFCLYPNTLNVVGDSFNEEEGGERVDNAFFPLQSRPLFSMIGLIDTAFNVDGFTVVYDDGILDTLRSDYYVSDNLAQNSDGAVAEVIAADVVSITQAVNDFPVFNTRDYDQFAQFDPNVFSTLDGSAFNGFDNIDDAILVPSANLGELVFRPASNTTAGVNWFAVFEGLTPTDDVVFVEDSFIGGVSGNFTVNTIIEDLPNPGPTSNGNFIGYVLLAQTAFVANLSGNVSESSIDNITLPIDRFSQFNATALPGGSSTVFYTVNLLELMPDKTLIEVIKPMLVRHGLLWDINTNDKTVFIYNYSRYFNNIDNATDISRFLLDEEIREYDTDYGKDYGRVNNIGLDDPFRGNTFNLEINNNNELSKYEEYKENHVEDLKDVNEVIFVENSNVPYFEYKHEGEGVVSVDGNAQLDLEYRILRTNFIGGSFVPTNVTGGRVNPYFVQNVNYAQIPDGVRAWYDLIDRSVRVAVKFLFPPNFISNLDITLPVYVDQLNGFYIVEEVEEYIDGCTPVRVRLIKINL